MKFSKNISYLSKEDSICEHGDENVVMINKYRVCVDCETKRLEEKKKVELVASFSKHNNRKIDQ